MKNKKETMPIGEGQEILLHCCCGPCSTSSIERLLELDWVPILFYQNDNIYPKEEWEKRYKQLEKVAKHYSLKLVGKEDYNHIAWRAAIKGYEAEPEHGQRCRLCFNYNLNQASKKAKELGIKHFTTTLTVSRFKNSKQIFLVGDKFTGFEEIDFKKKNGFSKSVIISNELNLYRQQYCGCEFSLNPLKVDNNESNL